MGAPAFKTLSEQRVAHLEALRRPLTDEESDLLRRSLHAVYERNRRHRLDNIARKEELRQADAIEREWGWRDRPGVSRS